MWYYLYNIVSVLIILLGGFGMVMSDVDNALVMAGVLKPDQGDKIEECAQVVLAANDFKAAYEWFTVTPDKAKYQHAKEMFNIYVNSNITNGAPNDLEHVFYLVWAYGYDYCPAMIAMSKKDGYSKGEVRLLIINYLRTNPQYIFMFVEHVKNNAGLFGDIDLGEFLNNFPEDYRLGVNL